MPALQNLGRAALGFTLLGTLSLGCQRKAPGPEECARFAEAVVGVHRYITPVIAAQIETQTRECLTQPYDRELIDCVMLTGQGRRCLGEFRARNAGARDQAEQEFPR